MKNDTAVCIWADCRIKNQEEEHDWNFYCAAFRGADERTGGF